ncbi:MAG: hypothetical protein WA739_00455, partial [Candidatus Acidiferrales bacterium]
MSQRRILQLVIASAIVFAALPIPAVRSQQKMDSINLERAQGMLRDAYDNVKKHYYDPKFHGIDLDARYHEYDDKVRNAASLSHAFGVIAGFLDGLNDSHTFFSPPSRPYRVDYGYRMQMYGSECFISRVRPGTDAESKIHPGDQVLGYNNYAVNRGDFWKMSYYFSTLAPQKGSILEVRDTSGQSRRLMIDAKVRELKKVVDLTGADGGSDIGDLIREEENSDHVVRQRWVN